MGSKSTPQTTTQTTTLPPQYQQAFTSILNQANALQPQPVMRTAQRTGSFDGYGNYTPGGTYQVPTGQYSGGVTDITPDLSSQTMRGINVLSQGPDAQAMSLLRDTAGGKYLSSNPYAGQSDISGVTDAITQAATRAVGDRFSQAGRTGSPGEGLALGNEVARQLAPYAFGASESALSRGFNSFENERARQLNAVNPLFNAQQQYGQNLLTAGSILEDQQRQQMLEPFNLFNLRTDPLIRALGGAPTTTSTTSPYNRNVGAGVLGGAATGAGIGSALALSNPWTAGLAIGGGLLGGFL